MKANRHLSNEFVWNNKNATIVKDEMNIHSSEIF